MTITVGNRGITIRIALTRSTCYASYDRDRICLVTRMRNRWPYTRLNVRRTAESHRRRHES